MNRSANAHTWFQSLSWLAVDFVFPAECPLCDARNFCTPQYSGVFCPTCTQELAPQTQNRCQRCAAEIGPYATSENGCTHCRNRTLRFESVVCLGMYEGPLRKAILSAKWSFSAVRMRALAKLLASHCLLELQECKIDCVIPVPQHWQKRAVRHFNPAWIIAEEVSAALGVPCNPHVLRRQRTTRLQKRVAVSQRFQNQADSFQIANSKIIEGRRVLLIDDVLTTGATCSEAASVLKQFGAATCHVAVLGRVLDHSA